MNWTDIFLSFIVIGLIIDFFSMICIVSYEFGICDRRGFPIGPIFYMLGFLQLFFINKKPIGILLFILLCCFLFYALVICSAVISHKIVKLIRRLKSSNSQIFYSNKASGISIEDTIRSSLKYIMNNGINMKSKDYGYIYVRCFGRMFKKAIIHVLRTGESCIDVVEDDPGHIKCGRFASDITEGGFSIAQWQITKRKEVVVPQSDYNRIPEFVGILFRKYYSCGDTCQIKVEAFKM